jgi:TonB-dependent SusC/RagA subfamily outer membrane receptor
LQGTVSGVNVTSTSGAPGASLIFVSGVLWRKRTNNYRWICWRIRFVKSNDIETITVLKDAQAAIYGTIGANGVILITTKTGKRIQSQESVSIHTQVFRDFKKTKFVKCHRVCIIQ